MKNSFVALALCLLGGAALAQSIEVRDAWVRASVQGQKSTGAFMKISAPGGIRLVGGSTPVAGQLEVHEMKMDGDVMRMRALSGVDIPAGKTVEFKSGGLHIMLLNLKAALPKGSQVPLTLVFKDARGAESKLELQLPVSVAPPGAAADGHTHGVHKH
ncbi:copper chaperone PCu(A)C [Ramlibacter sp. 2FC]|uniref:copper chaperone PCu(A)C n=1 Tax=Ramlibacter sp. 2FC TaxID=2502188 RepID=UPI0010F86ECE|nr:copper chaperone PCu(A)C [Ramlibacter sp. 2FC]